MKIDPQLFRSLPRFIGQLCLFLFLLINAISSINAQETKALENKVGEKNNANKALPNRAVKPSTVAPVAVATAALAPGDRCTGDPKFLEKIGFSKRSLVDTTSTHRVGLMVIDVNAQGQRGRTTQHESWSRAGFLGRVQRDRDGHLYTYPAPSVTLVHNPVDKANIIYRVDSETGIMAAFAEVPKEAPATEQNPFGLLALALDCEANALYAASVYGSTASSEKGVIARIDLATKNVTILKRDVDALSLLVAVDRRGKRLYVGTARDNAMVSYGFKPDGTLADDEAIEIKFDTLKSALDKRPRVLRVDLRGLLYVRAIPFDYNLAARSSTPTAELHFVRNTTSGAFELSEEKLTEVRAAPVPPLPPH